MSLTTYYKNSLFKLFFEYLRTVFFDVRHNLKNYHLTNDKPYGIMKCYKLIKDMKPYKVLEEYEITHISKHDPNKILARYTTTKDHADRVRTLDHRYWKVRKLEKPVIAEYLHIW